MRDADGTRLLRRVRFADPSDSSDISEEDDVDDVDEGEVTGERRVQTLPRVLQWDLDAVRWIVRQREVGIYLFASSIGYYANS
ncbi:hypothetical protein ATCC90586_011491 [Pythium insidiosum]|nr:hypothetical protein ATCC90586_011491 [Pythium insidiosum]